MRQRTNRAVHRRQHRINNLIKLTFGLLGLLAAIGLVFVLMFYLAKRQFVPSEVVYLRDIYILVDQTRSMDDAQISEVKSVIQTELVDRFGLGDRVFCYRIGSDFHEIRDRVFAGEQDRFKVPGNLDGVPVESLPGDLKAELIESWQLFETEQRSWAERLAKLEPAEGQYSDYLGTVRNIGRRIKNDPSVAAEQWLIIAGDLEHDMPNTRLEDAVASKDEKWQFSGVTVYLVYPGGTHDEEDQRRIEEGWRKYFASRGNKHINIVSFDQFIGDFSPNRIPRAEALKISQE